MHRFLIGSLLVLTVSFPASTQLATAGSLPYTEEFTTGTANWTNAASTATTYVPSGGPAGASEAYISTVYTEPSSTSASTLFRGQDNLNSSDGAFVGDWVAAGIEEFSFYVRQNSSASLIVGTRFATTANFPAFSDVTETTVPPDVWTKITIDISPTNANLQPEGPVAFDDVFQNIAKLQILTSRGSLDVGTQVTFDLARVSAAVPEPGSIVLAAAGAGVALCGMVLRRRRVNLG